MKVVASTERGYLVEMTADEVAKAAGFHATYSEGWISKNRGRREPIIGSAMDVDAAYNFHNRISQAQEKCTQSAGFLRGLADMIERSLPDVITHPDAIEAKTDDEVQS